MEREEKVRRMNEIERLKQPNDIHVIALQGQMYKIAKVFFFSRKSSNNNRNKVLFSEIGIFPSFLMLASSHMQNLQCSQFTREFYKLVEHVNYFPET